MSNSPRLYDYATSDEGAAGFEDRFFWGTDVQQLTREELEAEYNDGKNKQLRSAFGSFDNYMAYMDERQDLIDSGELKPQWWAEDGTVIDVENQSGLAFELDSEDPNFRNNIDDYMIARGQSGYSSQSEIFNKLYQKYTGGSLDGKLANDGDRFQWNGSSFVRTYENPISGVIDKVLPMVPFIVGGYHLAPAIAGKVGGGMLGNAVGAGASSAATQLGLTGSVDPRSVLSSAVIGGLNPGGMLAENFGQATGAGVNIVPDNVIGSFLQGSVNSAVGDLISTGDVSLKNALMMGGINAGAHAIMDTFSDSDQFAIESEMDRIAKDREALGLDPLTGEELFEAATGSLTLKNTSGSLVGPPEYGGPASMLGKTDMAGLIGKDGLLSFIPEMPTGWINKLMGGGAFSAGEFFVGPDGKRYTDIELYEKGIDPADVVRGNVDGWESFKVAGNPVDSSNRNFLDALADKQFENTYGVNPTEYINGATGNINDTRTDRINNLKRITAYGPLDETYNFSENPRGQSQYVGLLTGFPDAYTTGSDNKGRVYNQWTDQWGGTQYDGIQDALLISNMQGAGVAPPSVNPNVIVNLSESGASPNATLPGAGNSFIDAITRGLLYGGFSNDDDTSSSGASDANTGGNQATVKETSDSTAEPAPSTASSPTPAPTPDPASEPDPVDATTPDSNVTPTYELPINDDGTVTLPSGITVPSAIADSIFEDKYVPGANDELTPSTSSDALPSGGSSPSGGGDLNFSGKDGLPPLWTELYGYTKISPYKKARLKVLEGMLGGMMGGGLGNFNDFQFGANKDPYQKIGKSLYEAGIKE